MSQFQSNLAHGNIAYGHPLHPHHLLSGLQALRDTALGFLLSVSVIGGVAFYQTHQKAAPVEAPSTALRYRVPITAKSQLPDTNNQPVASALLSGGSSADLQAILNKWQADHSGAQFGVVVRELGGAGRSAVLDADKPLAAASLYKLYLEDYIYTGLADGSISSSNSLGGPKSLTDCLDAMIVFSDNACGEAIASTIGWVNLNNFVHSAGFGETKLAYANTTSANDMANFLDQLQAGTLLRSDYSAQLIANMEKQIYRSAIPAGDPGDIIADKVGIINSNWNDVAIVYGPKTTYILVVMSNNSGSAPIADLSGHIANFMNQ